MDILQKVNSEKERALRTYRRAKNITDIRKAYAIFDRLCKDYHHLWLEKKVTFQEKVEVFTYAEFLYAVMSTYFFTLKKFKGRKIFPHVLEHRIRQMIMFLRLAKRIYYGDALHKPLINHTLFMKEFLKKLEFTIIDYRQKLNKSVHS